VQGIRGVVPSKEKKKRRQRTLCGIGKGSEKKETMVESIAAIAPSKLGTNVRKTVPKGERGGRSNAVKENEKPTS